MTSDEDLLQSTPDDANAFAEFYRRYEKTLVLYFVRRVGAADLAVDLTAETFAAALASAKRFKPQGEDSAARWLFGIAGHVLSRSLRRKQVEDRARRRIGTPPLALTDDLLDRIDGFAHGEEAMTLLAELPAAQREAIGERVIKERDYDEIARDLSCSEAVVRQRVSRGLSTLRARMEEGS